MNNIFFKCVNKIIILAFFFNSLAFGNDLSSDWVCPQKEVMPKKVMILYNMSGGGHVAASKAIKDLLKPYFCLSFINTSEAIVPHIPGIGTVDDLYNKMKDSQFFNLINFLAKSLRPLTKISSQTIQKNFSTLLEKMNPDLVVSTVPIINDAVISAMPVDLPYLLVTLDTDLGNWRLELTEPKENLIVTTGYQSQDDIKKFSNNVSIQQIKNIGFPIRSDFLKYSTKEQKERLRELGNLDKKFVVLIIAGGVSSDSLIEKIATLEVLNAPLYLMVVCGNNPDLKLAVEQHLKNSSLPHYILGFTDQVAKLMAISNVVISKPGPGVMNEAVTMNLPIISDISHGVMEQEAKNSKIIKDRGWGVELTNSSQLGNIINKMRNDPQYYLTFKSNLEKANLSNFNELFLKIAARLAHGKPVTRIQSGL